MSFSPSLLLLLLYQWKICITSSRYLILRFYTDSNPGQLPQKSGVCASTLGHHIISTFSFVLIQKSIKKFICNSPNFEDILQGFKNEKDKETLEKHGFFLTLENFKRETQTVFMWKNEIFFFHFFLYCTKAFSKMRTWSGHMVSFNVDNYIYSTLSTLFNIYWNTDSASFHLTCYHDTYFKYTFFKTLYCWA